MILQDGSTLESVKRLSKDIAKSTQQVSQKQAKFLVDSYYSIQEWRVATDSRSRALAKEGQPQEIMEYTSEQMEILEKQVAKALGYFVDSNPLGVWMRSIIGVGPVIAAGLLSSVDWEGTNVATKLWSYAGLNPSAKWLKGQKRPWNAFLKTLSYKIGESFIKFQRHHDDFYGKWYAYRKSIEWERNLTGKFADQAIKKMNEQPVGSDTNSYHWYVGNIDPAWAQEIVVNHKLFPASLPDKAFLPEGAERFPMLPPAHIHSRARRYAVKLFLSHCVEISNWIHHKQLGPTIYIIAKESHADYIYPHNIEIVEEMVPGIINALEERYGPRYSRVQNPPKTRLYLGEEETSGELVQL